MFRTNNPIISKVGSTVDFVSEEASFKGVMSKVGMLVLVTILSAIGAVSGLLPDSLVMTGLILSGLGTFLCILIGSIFPTAAKVTSWIYAFAEGVLIGFVCLIAEEYVPGISIMAVSVTACIFFSLLIMYSTKIINVTSKFQKIVYTVFFSMFFGSIILMLVNLFTNGSVAGFLNNYSVALVISLIYVVLASAMLLIDFERIQTAVNYRVDKKYEWTLALGLMVTLVWLFMEILRLILIIASRNRD